MPCLIRSRESAVCLLLLALLLGGCRSSMGPRMPKELSAPAATAYSRDQFNADVAAYRTAASAGDLEKARTLRNQIAYHIMADVESSYSRFEMSLYSTRAVQSTLSDATELGLTAATAVVGATDVKDILAASSAAFQGTWTSYDKNFFQQKTTEAIIAQMRASRKSKLAQLITALDARDVNSYPWDAVWIDLVEFYYAGTIPSAMVEIASTAGAKADEAARTLKNAQNALTPRTPAQARQAVDIRATYDHLKTALAEQDHGRSESARATLREILKTAGYSPEANASSEDLLELFRKAMAEAATDNDKLATLNAAVAAANLK